jgi:uncharacterized protein (TIGR02284 family)
MATKATTRIDDATLSTLQDLIQVNIDSQKGFREAADSVVDMSVSSLFRLLAAERKQQAADLKSLLAQYGAEPGDSGAMAVPAHRAWMDFRKAVGGGLSAVLSEVERGENHVEEKYENALKGSSAPPFHDVLNRQSAAVKQAHDRVRDLREANQD